MDFLLGAKKKAENPLAPSFPKPAAPAPDLDPFDTAYQQWKKRPGPDTMDALLKEADPVLDSAIQSYGGGNKALRGRAKVLAMDAFEKYDPQQGTKLRTHVMNQLQPLSRHQREYSSITHVPERVQLDAYRLKQEQSKFHDEFGREPSDGELAERTGLSAKRIRHVRTFNRPDMAESMFTDDEGGVVLPGTVKPDYQSVWIEYVHHDLDPVDQKILEWKTGYNGSKVLENQEIARRLGLTPGAVSQRSAKISAKLAEMEALDA